MEVRRQVSRVGFLDRLPAAGQRHRRHGRAVIGLCGRDHLPSIRLATIDVILAGQAQRRLVDLRTAGGKPDARHLRRQLDEAVGQLLHRLVGEVVHVEISHALGLLGAGLDDLAGAIPQRRDHRAA